jgi:hypothetical protein
MNKITLGSFLFLLSIERIGPHGALQRARTHRYSYPPEPWHTAPNSPDRYLKAVFPSKTLQSSPMPVFTALATSLKNSIRDFRLQYPLNGNFTRRISRWFAAILIVVAVILMVITAAAQAYEAISVYSREYNGNTLLWYERLLGNATSRLGLPQSWVCSGSIIQLGEGTYTYCSTLI